MSGTETNGRFRIRWPAERIREQQQGKGKGRSARMPKLSKDQLIALADDEEALVPIRLDIEHGELKLRDVFTWNLRDPHMTADVFALTLCDDLQLPENPFRREIAGLITEQLEEARKSNYGAKILSKAAPAQDDAELFWSKWREAGGVNGEPSVPIPVALPFDHEELRIVIRVRWCPRDRADRLDRHHTPVSQPRRPIRVGHLRPQQLGRGLCGGLCGRSRAARRLRDGGRALDSRAGRCVQPFARPRRARRRRADRP